MVQEIAEKGLYIVGVCNATPWFYKNVETLRGSSILGERRRYFNAFTFSLPLKNIEVYENKIKLDLL